MLGVFTTPLSVINKTSRQKIIKTMKDLNHTGNQLNPTNISRTLQEQQNSVFFHTHMDFPHDKQYSESHNKLKIIELIQTMFPDHNRIKLQVKDRNVVRKSPQMFGN